MKIVALMYHNLAEAPGDEYSLTPDAFREQLQWLKANGATAEGFSGLEKRLDEDGPWPERYVLLTFDDGHGSNLRAAEMLEREGMSATFFLTRDATQREGFLKEPEIRELARSMDVGCHGVTHRSLLKMGRAKAEAELAESKRWLEDVIGRPVTSFSAPGGDIDGHLCRRARELGYRLVGTSEEWWNDLDRIRRLGIIRRLMVFRSYGLEELEDLVSRRLPFYLRRRARYASTTLAKRLLPEAWIPAAVRLKHRILGH